MYGEEQIPSRVSTLRLCGPDFMKLMQFNSGGRQRQPRTDTAQAGGHQ